MFHFTRKEIFILYTCAFLFGVLIYEKFAYLSIIFIPFIFLKSVRFIPLCIAIGMLSFFIKSQNLKFNTVGSMNETEVIGKIEKIYFKKEGIRALISLEKDEEFKKLIASFKTQAPIKLGETLQITGLLIPLPQKVYPTFYDVEMKNRYEKVAGYISVQNYEVLKTDFSLTQIIRSYILNTLSNFQNEDYKSVAVAILIGDKGKIKPEVYNIFKTSGLAHILAISGLHMSISIFLFFGICYKLLALTPLCNIYDTKKISAVLGIVVGFLYLMASSFPVSGIRSFIMACFLFCSFIFERGASHVRSLCLALIIILCIMPQEVLFPSFQLSFASVLCLLYCYKFTPFENKILNHIIAIITSSFFITIATAPLVVHHFSYVHFYGAIFNVFAIPFLAVFIMPIALLNIASGGMFVWLFEFGINILFQIANVSLKLPFSSIFFPYFNPYLLVVYIFGLIFTLCFTNKRIGLCLISCSLIAYCITAKMPKIVVNEKYIAIKHNNDYIVPYKIPDGFLKEIWMQNLNTKFTLYKNISNLDFVCKKGVCIKENEFTIVYTKSQKNIKCEGEVFINTKSDFVPENCNARKIIVHSNLTTTPILIY